MVKEAKIEEEIERYQQRFKVKQIRGKSKYHKPSL